MTMFDPNAAFAALHDKFRKCTITAEEYNERLRAILVRAGKLSPKTPFYPWQEMERTEVSGNLSYHWDFKKTLSITLLKPWDGQHRLNGFPRHVRQAARLELDEKMTEVEAAKLHVAQGIGDTVFEAVMDDLLSARAEEILQMQGPDTRRAVNLDERFHLADNPDLIRKEEVGDLVGAWGRKALPDMER
jgi:hypothetical protein